jgi:nucleotide-binding universal stress UspA family protein
MEIKIEKILACVDASEYSTAVMKYSAYVAKAFEAHLKALHVIDILQLEGPFMYDLSGVLGLEPFANFSSKIKAMLEEKGRNILTSFKEIAEFYGVDIETVMEIGIVSSKIIEHSEEADLVFIGKKGVNASFERGILGSNIESVVRKIKKPLFVANQHFMTPKTLVVAYDGSSVAEKALEYAKLYKNRFQSTEIKIVNVGTNEEKAEKMFSLLPTYILKKFIHSDDVENSIIRFTKEQEKPLLFIGAYAKNRILEMILGSTTEAILRSNTNFPIFIAR